MSNSLVPLKKIVKIHYGKALKAGDRDETGQFPVFGSSGQVGTHDKNLIDYPTLIIGRKGSVGKVTYAESGGWAIDTAFYTEFIKANEVDLRYFFYALKNTDLARWTITTSIPGLNRDDLYSTEIPLPPLEEQKRIAAILDKADRVRRKRQEAIRLTEELGRSIFLDMFGDPVTNPKGWEIKKLSTTFSKTPQIGIIKPAHADGHYPVIRVGEIGNREVDLEKCGRVTLSEQETEKFRCNLGDVLLARAIGSESHLGKASMLQETDQIIVFDSHVMRLRFDSNIMLPDFFIQWLTTQGGRHLFMKKAGRTAVQFNVNGKQISSIDIPLPPVHKQREFSRIYSKLMNSLSKSENIQELNNSLFNSLLQRAFRGEL
jgi:type I restriction enzyme, S subunit